MIKKYYKIIKPIILPKDINTTINGNVFYIEDDSNIDYDIYNPDGTKSTVASNIDFNIYKGIQEESIIEINYDIYNKEIELNVLLNCFNNIEFKYLKIDEINSIKNFINNVTNIKPIKETLFDKIKNFFIKLIYK